MLLGYATYLGVKAVAKLEEIIQGVGLVFADLTKVRIQSRSSQKKGENPLIYELRAA